MSCSHSDAHRVFGCTGRHAYELPRQIESKIIVFAQALDERRKLQYPLKSLWSYNHCGRERRFQGNTWGVPKPKLMTYVKNSLFGK